MLTGTGGMPNVILFIAGLVLVVAGVFAIRRREGVAEYLRELRTQIMGAPVRPRGSKPLPLATWIPLVAGVILIGFGIIGVAGGLFATLPPPGTPRV